MFAEIIVQGYFMNHFNYVCEPLTSRRFCSSSAAETKTEGDYVLVTCILMTPLKINCWGGGIELITAPLNGK